ISPDGKTYTFFLRQGVKFHDGADFTAEDLHATYSRIIWPPKGISIPRTPLFSAVSDIKVVDPNTIVFQLSEPHPPNPSRPNQWRDRRRQVQRLDSPGRGHLGTRSAAAPRGLGEDLRRLVQLCQGSQFR